MEMRSGSDDNVARRGSEEVDVTGFECTTVCHAVLASLRAAFLITKKLHERTSVFFEACQF